MNIAEKVENAQIAPKCGEVALVLADAAHEEVYDLDEYSVYAESGEPMGEAYGLSHREAAQWWAVEHGTCAFIVVQRGHTAKTYWVDPHKDGSVSARECET